MAQTQMHAVDFLTGQHDEVRQLLRTTASSSGVNRREAFEALVRMLAVHETAEEMVVYPAIRRAGEEGMRIAEARIGEEDRAKKVLVDLERLGPDEAEFVSLFATFRIDVEAHAASEEREVFPLLERMKDDTELRKMATAVQAAERIAPTHPHKLAPESAAGNLVVGPFVAVIDRVRDAIRDATR